MESLQEKQQKEKVNIIQDNEKYVAALNLLFYEGQIAWQMNLLFIGLNVGIGTIIDNFVFDPSEHYVPLGIFSIIGIIINVAWLGTFRRNNKYYIFRMAQARESEPKNWRLVRERGYKFSKGGEIIIALKGIESNDKVHQLSSFEKKASNKFAIELAIWIFIIGFFILLFLCGYYFSRLVGVPFTSGWCSFFSINQ